MKDLNGLSELMPEYADLKRGQDNLKKYWNSFTVSKPGRIKKVYITVLTRLLQKAVAPATVTIKPTKTKCRKTSCNTGEISVKCNECCGSDEIYPPSV